MAKCEKHNYNQEFDDCPYCEREQRGRRVNWNNKEPEKTSIFHIHENYSWYCGGDGLQSTNDSHVTCPDCLARKPTITKDHPLYPFFIEMIKEYGRGEGKYGVWSTKDHDWQKKAVKSECLEWEATSLKTVDGEQREMEELTHLANVSGKRWIELKRG